MLRGVRGVVSCGCRTRGAQPKHGHDPHYRAGRRALTGIFDEYLTLRSMSEGPCSCRATAGLQQPRQLQTCTGTTPVKCCSVPRRLGCRVPETKGSSIFTCKPSLTGEQAILHFWRRVTGVSIRYRYMAVRHPSTPCHYQSTTQRRWWPSASDQVAAEHNLGRSRRQTTQQQERSSSMRTTCTGIWLASLAWLPAGRTYSTKDQF